MSIVFIVLILILVAFVIIFIGILLLMLSSMRSREGKVEGGGVIIIGPLPIVIGTGERISKVLLVLALVLTVVTLILFLLTSRFIPIIAPR